MQCGPAQRTLQSLALQAPQCPLQELQQQGQGPATPGYQSGPYQPAQTSPALSALFDGRKFTLSKSTAQLSEKLESDNTGVVLFCSDTATQECTKMRQGSKAVNRLGRLNIKHDCAWWCRTDVRDKRFTWSGPSVSFSLEAHSWTATASCASASGTVAISSTKVFCTSWVARTAAAWWSEAVVWSAAASRRSSHCQMSSSTSWLTASMADDLASAVWCEASSP